MMQYRHEDSLASLGRCPIVCRPRRHRVLPLVCAALFCSVILIHGQRETWASPPQGPETSPRKTTTIRGIRVAHVDRGVSEEFAWIRIHVLVDTPPRYTWEVIQDIAHWNRFTDLFSEPTVLPAEGPMERYRFHVSPPWPFSGGQTFVRVIRKPAGRTLDYWVESGIMAGTYGRIAVSEESGGASRILFENLGSPEQRFPDWMVRISVYLMVPRILKGLRQRILAHIEEVSRQAGETQAAP